MLVLPHTLENAPRILSLDPVYARGQESMDDFTIKVISTMHFGHFVYRYTIYWAKQHLDWTGIFTSSWLCCFRSVTCALLHYVSAGCSLRLLTSSVQIMLTKLMKYLKRTQSFLTNWPQYLIIHLSPETCLNRQRIQRSFSCSTNHQCQLLATCCYQFLGDTDNVEIIQFFVIPALDICYRIKSYWGHCFMAAWIFSFNFGPIIYLSEKGIRWKISKRKKICLRKGW